MPAAFDEAAVERLSQGLALRLPRTPHRGRVGEVRASSVGASMELHDFRAYQPGDDLRHVDWNAVARTGELILRLRHDEVTPRAEIILDASRSMALTPAKAARACEVALLLCRVAAQQGLEPTLTVVARRARRAGGAACAATLKAVEFDGDDALPDALGRAPPLRPCGHRLVVSDFLFEASMDGLAERLARGAAALSWIQLLDPEDTAPAGGFGARLVDSESGAFLERILTSAVLAQYHERLQRHQRAVQAAARRARASHLLASAADALESLVSRALAPVLVAA